MSGPDFDNGKITSTTLQIVVPADGDGQARLSAVGLPVVIEGDAAKVEEPLPQTPYFEKIGTLFDYYGDEPVVVSNVRQEASRIPKEIFYIPALLLLGFVFLSQRRRMSRTEEVAVPA